MLRILNLLFVLVFFVFIFTGCDSDVQKKPEPVAVSAPKPAPAPQPPPPQNTQAASAPAAETVKQPTVVRSASSAMPGLVVTDSSSERREVADVGVATKKGQNYGRLSIFNYAIPTYFRMQERISFDMIKHDMQLYEAMNGSAPKTHEEFMEKIIKANRSIKLPELKDGCRYEYNPETKELEVVYPVDN